MQQLSFYELKDNLLQAVLPSLETRLIKRHYKTHAAAGIHICDIIYP